jgi:hypothetical protein
MAGLLTFIGRTEASKEIRISLILFLIALSVIGIVIKLGLESYQHQLYAVEIAEFLGLGKYIGKIISTV